MAIREEHTAAQPRHKGGSTTARVLGAGVALGRDRVPAGSSRRRAVTRPDEDAVTLAAEAAAAALPVTLDRVGAILFATLTPPYEEGGSVQALAELLGLHGDVFAVEMSSSARDGLAMLRIAAALGSGAPVLVCAAHSGSAGPGDGDGAVALLIGDADAAALADGGPLAAITPAASSAIELRDRWRLRGDSALREADRSFVAAVGTEHLGRELLAAVPPALTAPVMVVGPDSRASSLLERSLGGGPDAVTSHTGVIGAAHPLLRLVAGLDAENGLVVAVANGLGEAVHYVSDEAGAEAARCVRLQAEEGGVEAQQTLRSPIATDFDPYASSPRAWRERDADLRLKGLFGPAEGLSVPPGRSHPTGTVLAWTEDHVYPGAAATEMASVDMDDGGRFYGQVAMGEHVGIGDRVELVPRRLHQGGGMIQYFWKVRPCR